jgi:hypothetical protein
LLAAVGRALRHAPSQLGNIDAYRTSPLIFIEVVGVLAAFGIGPLAFVRALHLIAEARPLAALFNGAICLLALAAVGAAFWIDAPTLLYAT